MSVAKKKEMGYEIPIKYSIADKARILKNLNQALSIGSYIETAVKYAGITEGTYYKWVKRGRRAIENAERLFEDGKIGKLEDGVEQADVEYIDFVVQLDDIFAKAEMKHLMNLNAHSKKNWQVSAWILERRYPERWGRKTVIANPKDNISRDDGFMEAMNSVANSVMEDAENENVINS